MVWAEKRRAFGFLLREKATEGSGCGQGRKGGGRVGSCCGKVLLRLCYLPNNSHPRSWAHAAAAVSTLPLRAAATAAAADDDDDVGAAVAVSMVRC